MVDIVSNSQSQAQQAATPAGAAIMRRTIKDEAKTVRTMTDQALDPAKKATPKQPSGRRRGDTLDILV